MRAQKGFKRRALEIGGIARGEGAQELKELIAGVSGEAVSGVADDVGMDVLGELEADGEAPRGCVGIGVRDERDAGGVGKRTTTGVDGRVMCGARVRSLAEAAGVKVPLSRRPLACTGRKPGLRPKMASNCLRILSLRARSFSSVGRGIGVFSCRVAGETAEWGCHGRAELLVVSRPFFWCLWPPIILWTAGQSP
jgi:hypothetical protein